MPIDREMWAKQLHLSNFVNSYRQYADIQKCGGRKILIIGPGQGLDTAVLRWRGYDVTTFDIDETFKPDCLGSVHDMSQFKAKQFDIVTASHVLEHLPVTYLDAALAELSRVALHALIYLPVAGRHGQVRCDLGVRGLSFAICWDLFNFLEKPDGVTPRYCGGQHYWEVGMRGFRVRQLKKRFEKHFSVVNSYRNHNWIPSYNFVLKST